MTEKIIPKAGKVLPQIREMAIGDTISFPIELLDTVRTQASKCNLLHGGKWITRADAESRLIYVERSE